MTMHSQWLMARGVRRSLALSHVPMSSRKCPAGTAECARIRAATGSGVVAEVGPEQRLSWAPPTAAPGKANFFLPGGMAVVEARRGRAAVRDFQSAVVLGE